MEYTNFRRLFSLVILSLSVVIANPLPQAASFSSDTLSGDSQSFQDLPVINDWLLASSDTRQTTTSGDITPSAKDWRSTTGAWNTEGFPNDNLLLASSDSNVQNNDWAQNNPTLKDSTSLSPIQGSNTLLANTLLSTSHTPDFSESSQIDSTAPQDIIADSPLQAVPITASATICENANYRPLCCNDGKHSLANYRFMCEPCMFLALCNLVYDL